MISAIFITAFLLTGLWFWHLWNKFALKCVRRREVANRRFHKYAKHVLEHEDTPEVALEFLFILNKEIARKGAAWTFYKYLFSEASIAPQNALIRKKMARMREFVDQRTALQDSYFAAVSNALLTIAFSAPVVCGLMLFWLGARGPQDKSVTLSFARYASARHA